MQTTIPLLQNVRVASPCEASWEGMEAVDGERVKFCLHCAKNVYNLSEMTQWEAEGLLRKHEGKLCARYYQRRDGTVLTRDCRIGAQAVRVALIRRSAVAASLFAMMFGAMAAVVSTEETHTTGDLKSAPMPKPTTVAPPLMPTPVAGGISITPVAPPVAPEPPTQLMGEIRPTPRMGKVARWETGQIASPPKTELHVRVGRVRIPEHADQIIAPVFNPSNEDNHTPVVDTSDEAILNPHR